MITILAEKPDMAIKIAAALDCITLGSKKIDFNEIGKYDKDIKTQYNKVGYFKINFDGQDTYVTSGRGHLGELKQAKDYNSEYKNWFKMPMPFIPEKYEIQLKSDRNSKLDAIIKFQFKTVKELLNKSSYVVCATDDDREGEVIFSYIYDLAKCKKPVKRATYDSTEKAALVEAFNSLEPWNTKKNLLNAGLMRSVADWVIGSNLTAAMTIHNTGKDILSIGRVQTPTLNMIVQRELAIKGHVKDKYWIITGDFTDLSGDRVYKGEHSAKKFTDKAKAEKICDKVKGKNGKIKSIEHKKYKKDAPKLFNLASLQMEANSRFGYTLDKTLEIAQFLYDKGFTTYPRTKSQHLTDDMEPYINDVLDMLKTNPDYKELIDKGDRLRLMGNKHYFDTSKVKSHYAIVPTRSKSHGLTAEQQNVYDLITRSVIKMIYGAAILNKITMTTDVSGEEFVSTGTSVIEQGWMVCGGGIKSTELPVYKEKEIVKGDFKLNEKETEPPKRYNDNTLVAAMVSAGKDLKDEELKKILCDPEVEGIGTDATRAAIVKTLEARGYIERKGKSIYATEKGISLINTLPVNDLKSAEITARWEKRLSNIADGLESAEDFKKDIEDTLRKWCKEIDSTKISVTGTSYSSIKSTGEIELDCPCCGQKIIRYKWGWGCSGYKSGCKFSVSGVILKKKITDNQFKKLIEKKSTGSIKGFISSKGNEFSAELVLKSDGTTEFKFLPTMK